MDTPPYHPVEADLLHATCLPDGTVTTRNDAWTALFGAGPELWAFLSEADRPQAWQCVRDAAAGHLVTRQIFPVHRPDRDEPVPVLLHFLPVHLPDGVTAVSIVGETLAEPTTWVSSQTQRDRMANLGHMTMGIAHDFNNLLSTILGHAELMKTEGDAHTPAQQESLQAIERAALDGAALIRKIQRYIRQEKLSEFEPVHLDALVRDVIALTRPYWYNDPRRKGISIKIKRRLAEVPPILGSPTELREVLVNLVLNAVQAMPHGGDLSIETRHDPATGVQMIVRDTGIGMPDDVRRRIFEPLFTTKGQHGTGMGLAVSYGIIQEHGGTIDVTSAPGEGTTFTLTFPSVAQPDHPDQAPPTTAVTRHARILVVDDEDAVRTVLDRLLTLRGHTIRQAASGPEALRLARSESFDIVFTDQAMPDMSGRQFAHALRQQYPHLPIVLLTGDTDQGTVDDDIDAVLSKPFKVDDLEAVIQSLI